MLTKNMVQGRLVDGSLGQVIGFQSLGEARGQNTKVAEVDSSKDPNFLRGRRQETITDIEASASADKLWPVVRFANGKTLLLTPVEFEVVNVRGTMEARRDQIPLILAWALSMSQGQSLQRVKIDLGKVFEKGQAYVALSRATSMDGPQVLHFHLSKVMAHPRVLAWQEKIDKSVLLGRPKESIASVGRYGKPLDKPKLAEPDNEFDPNEARESYWATLNNYQMIQ